MKAIEIINRIYEYGKDKITEDTCDTLKAGSPDAEVTKIAVAMFPTVQVIRDVAGWGAQLLIVHEPVYYNHIDEHFTDPIEVEKRALIEKLGLTIYRFHDHPHYAKPDIISQGLLNTLQLDGEIEYTDFFDNVRVKLKTPVTPREFAGMLEKKLDIKHIGICGAADEKCTRYSFMPGAIGKAVIEELNRDKCEVVLTGETCEWAQCEHVRDAAQLGHRKAMLVAGHVCSEREGMKYTAQIISEMFPGIETKYFESGQIYTYSD